MEGEQKVKDAIMSGLVKGQGEKWKMSENKKTSSLQQHACNKSNELPTEGAFSKITQRLFQKLGITS